MEGIEAAVRLISQLQNGPARPVLGSGVWFNTMCACSMQGMPASGKAATTFVNIFLPKLSHTALLIMNNAKLKGRYLDRGAAAAGVQCMLQSWASGNLGLLLRVQAGLGNIGQPLLQHLDLLQLLVQRAHLQGQHRAVSIAVVQAIHQGVRGWM